MTKTTEELIQEFLDNGGEIEKLDPIEPDQGKTVSSTSSNGQPDLMTLPEGADMFGEKRKRRKKKQSAQNIDKELIPEHLHHILDKPPADDKQEKNKGGTADETN